MEGRTEHGWANTHMEFQRRSNQLFKKHNPTCFSCSLRKNREPRTSSNTRLSSFFHCHYQREWGISIASSTILEPQCGFFINSYIHPQLWVKNLDCKTHCALWFHRLLSPQARFCKGFPASCATLLCSEKPSFAPCFPARRKSFFPAAPVSLHLLVHFSCLQLSKSQHISLLSFWSSCPNMDLQWQGNCFALNSAKQGYFEVTGNWRGWRWFQKLKEFSSR